jgi:hypothetical protein
MFGRRLFIGLFSAASACFRLLFGMKGQSTACKRRFFGVVPTSNLLLPPLAAAAIRGID